MPVVLSQKHIAQIHASTKSPANIEHIPRQIQFLRPNSGRQIPRQAAQQRHDRRFVKYRTAISFAGREQKNNVEKNYAIGSSFANSFPRDVSTRKLLS